MNKAIRILNIITILLAAFQLMAYIGIAGSPPTNATGINAVAYYTGFNLPLILAAILFAISVYLKKKIKKTETQELIDSIGKK